MVDYDEQASAVIQDALRVAMPPKLRAIYDDKETRSFLSTRRVEVPRPIHWLNVYSTQSWSWESFTASFPVAALAAGEMSALKGEQERKRAELRAQLKAVAYGCTTDGALRKALPEFAKYLPTEPPPSANLPAVANVVAGFVEAGWPKGKVAEVVS